MTERSRPIRSSVSSNRKARRGRVDENLVTGAIIIVKKNCVIVVIITQGDHLYTHVVMCILKSESYSTYYNISRVAEFYH